MIGISEIRNLTAKFTDDETLRAQLSQDLETLYGDYDSAKSSALSETRASEDSLVDAQLCQNLSKRCGEEITSVDAARNQYNCNVTQKCEEDCESTRRAALDTTIHLQKFVDSSGMCGMGMGMGNTYSEEGAIDLTVEELMAMKDVLIEIGDSQETFDSNFESVVSALNAKFEEDGTNSHASVGSEDGTSFVQISREDGSTVKIYDANGNGALDTKDYDFCQAISQACEIVSQMESQIEGIRQNAQAAIDASNDAADRTIADLQNKQASLDEQFATDKNDAKKHMLTAENYSAEAKDAKNQARQTEAEIQNLDGEMAKITQQLNELDEDESQTELNNSQQGVNTPTDTAEPEINKDSNFGSSTVATNSTPLQTSQNSDGTMTAASPFEGDTETVASADLAGQSDGNDEPQEEAPTFAQAELEPDEENPLLV